MASHYFLGSRLLGSSPKPYWWSDEDLSQCSIAMFCRECGEVWGRVLIDGKRGWMVNTTNCLKHADPNGFRGLYGGSFIAPWRKTFAELPSEVLRYELQIRLDNLKEFP